MLFIYVYIADAINEDRTGFNIVIWLALIYKFEAAPHLLISILPLKQK